MDNPVGAIEIPLFDVKDNLLKGKHPGFLKGMIGDFDWCDIFLQKEGKDIGEKYPFLQGVFNVTSLHSDVYSKN